MCNDYRAVAQIEISVNPHNVGSSYWLLVRHRHKSSDRWVSDRYEWLAWEELTEVLERSLDDCRPDFRHVKLLPEQESLTF